MKAVETDIYEKKRSVLHEQIPLDTPYAFSIEPSSCCNLRCNYCAHSLGKQRMEENHHVFANMSDEIFELVVKQLKEFPHPVRAITFGGMGEPTLHKKLPEMVRSVNENHVADRIHLITNGTLLTHELSRGLVEAGLDTMKISLQGLSDAAYEKNCGVRIQFDRIYEEIRFLYENRGKLRLGIKVPNTCLEPGEEEKFYQLFGDYCDEISVEKIIPIFPGVDYSKVIKGEIPLSRFALERTERRRVCSLVFYRMSVYATGKVVACCTHTGLSTDNMDVTKQSLSEIWNGKERRTMMMNNLRGIYEGITARCKNCKMRDDTAYEEDMLDDYAKELYEKLAKIQEES